MESEGDVDTKLEGKSKHLPHDLACRQEEGDHERNQDGRWAGARARYADERRRRRTSPTSLGTSFVGTALATAWPMSISEPSS